MSKDGCDDYELTDGKKLAELYGPKLYKRHIDKHKRDDRRWQIAKAKSKLMSLMLQDMMEQFDLNPDAKSINELTGLAGLFSPFSAKIKGNGLLYDSTYPKPVGFKHEFHHKQLVKGKCPVTGKDFDDGIHTFVYRWNDCDNSFMFNLVSRMAMEGKISVNSEFFSYVACVYGKRKS